jgi:hypothetical protein
MTLLRSSIFVVMAVGTLALVPSPLHAQNGYSDGTGSTSDMSGVLTQSDSYLFQSDEARIRMSDVASSLTQALQTGTLDASVVGVGQTVPVPSSVRTLLMASPETSVAAAQRSFVDVLTTRGLPEREANRLAETTAGLLDGGTASPTSFLEAVEAYNAAVNAAPAGLLARPPHELVVVRAVLTALLEGAV